MGYLWIFALSFTIALSGALAPGPLLAAVISQSARQGAKIGPLIILGHAAVELVMVIFIVVGLARFINTPVVIKAISLSGAVILVYSGISLMLSIKTVSLEESRMQKHAGNPVLIGIIMSISNPYWSIWWLTIGMGLVLAAQKSGLIGIMVFFLGHILADLGWYSFVSFSLSRGSERMGSGLYRMILIACALVLIGFGSWFAFYALIIMA